MVKRRGIRPTIANHGSINQKGLRTGEEVLVPVEKRTRGSGGLMNWRGKLIDEGVLLIRGEHRGIKIGRTRSFGTIDRGIQARTRGFGKEEWGAQARRHWDITEGG
jgi:hypothetical protein